MTEKDNEPMILEGDCIEVMKEFDENTFDAVVTDPPYLLSFMGKDWDKGLLHEKWLTEAYRILKPGASMLVMGGTRTFHRLMVAIEDSGFIIKDTLMWIYGSGFPKCQDITPHIDGKILGITTKQVKERREVIGKNPHHRTLKETNTMCGEPHTGDGNITQPLTEEAKHWDGFKIGGIKPAYEPIVWAVKPPEGSYIDNVLKWGVGAVNVDECRVGYNSPVDKQEQAEKNPHTVLADNQIFGDFSMCKEPWQQPKGRFPANIILSHHPECEQVGVKRVRGSGGNPIKGDKESKGILGWKTAKTPRQKYDSNGFETVESWDCHPDCAIRIMDEQSGDIKGGYRKNPSQQHGAFFGNAGEEQGERGYNDNGGASRFFYCAKASRGERNKGLEEMEKKERAGINKMMGNEKGGKSMRTGSGNIRNNKLQNSHPTVKPLKLFEYLIKLVTRKNQIILDPFLGSGTTMIAANNVDRECVGIEREGEYIPIAEKRVEYWLKKREKND